MGVSGFRTASRFCVTLTTRASRGEEWASDSFAHAKPVPVSKIAKRSIPIIPDRSALLTWANK
jgi:hypothetical protein